MRFKAEKASAGSSSTISAINSSAEIALILCGVSFGCGKSAMLSVTMTAALAAIAAQARGYLWDRAKPMIFQKLPTP